MELGGLQKTTLIDYPGRVAATIFLIRCNFRCPFCYSAELALPEKIKIQPRIKEKEFFSFLKKRKGLLTGVVICGGEPTIHKDLPDFIKKIKKMGFSIKLDTNGSNPKMIKDLINKKLIDYIALDVKATKEKYFKATGLSIKQGKEILKKIEQTIKILKESKIDYEFRTTVVPNLHKKEDIINIGKWLSPAKKYYLQNFRPEKTIDQKFEKIKPYSPKELNEIKKEVSSMFERCEIRV